MRTDLCVDGDRVNARGREIARQRVRVFDHQVRIKRQCGRSADRLNRDRSKGQVWHKSTIHHVEMNGVGPSRA
jgi:hypothetical protein